MSNWSFFLLFYFCLFQTNLCSSGSKIKALEYLFRGEIHMLREEIKTIVAQQEVVMKTLNETIELLQDPTLHPNKESTNYNKNSAEGVIAPAGAKVTGATIRTWLLNKFISFLAVLTWKTGLKKM